MIKNIIYSMHPALRKVLQVEDLNNLEKMKSEFDLSDGEISNSIALGIESEYIENNIDESELVVLDKFGEKFAKSDLPEIKVLREIVGVVEGKKMSELSIPQDEFSQAIGILKMNKLVTIGRVDNEMHFTQTENSKNYLDNYKNDLVLFVDGCDVNSMNDEQKASYEILKKRKGFLKIDKKKVSNYSFTELGKKIGKEIVENYKDLVLEEGLTTDMLKTGSYKNSEFRHYDTKLKTPMMDLGRRHPMIEANNIISDIFIEMGFSEMQGPMVESCFWNMDVMWIPQDHPARDEQDTFYLDGKCSVDKNLVEKVRNMHENGLNKTHTLKGEWSEDITNKRLLRTHSTATSFRTLNKLSKKMKDGEDINGKYYYVANNFRNEAVDATHLAEFFQAEGFIIGDDLSLADLMGFIKEFCSKLGINKIRFKPTFNPYTEPSMEAHYYDSKMDKWYALINSGIFRGETLAPIGLENKTIIAWGFGASRLATLLTGAKSMRDITGATCDFDWLKKRPIMTRDVVRK